MRIACVGSGLIGSGWATHMILRGTHVVLMDIDDDKLSGALQRIRRNLSFFYNEGLIDERDFDECLRRIETTTSVRRAVEAADFVQESVFESCELKQQVIAEIDRHCDADVIIASSTSGLLVSDIAKSARIPERVIGAHPYNPVQLIPLVEISKGEHTSEETVGRAVEFYRSIDKEPVVLRKEALGFIANRLAMALYREAVEIVDRGICTIEEIDRACCFGPGLRYALMGPNLIYQLGGGVHGITRALQHMGPQVEIWLEDMADWKKWPERYGATVQAGVDAEMRNRTPFEGRTNDEICNFRDKGLLMLLKFHGKYGGKPCTEKNTRTSESARSKRSKGSNPDSISSSAADRSSRSCSSTR